MTDKEAYIKLYGAELADCVPHYNKAKNQKEKSND